MDILKKANLLSNSGQFDSCGPKACDVKLNNGLGGIYHAKSEHKDCRIFKTLMDNRCSFDCNYCGNRAGCTKQKAHYEPDELAKLFTDLHWRHRVDGLFLSSGVSGNPDKATEKMIEAVKLLRLRYNFRGYIHFKVLPGTSFHLIKEASEYSTRMSVNIEAPNKSVLSELSSTKDFKSDILRRQAWISKLKLPGGQSTQVIINDFSTDEEILKMMRWQYEKLSLKRMYYASFRPVEGTPMEDEKPAPSYRERHLYNIDFLARLYSFDFKEFLSIMDDGMLPNEDPKLALARQTIDKPVDVNEASYEELIRVPGIGPKSARRIVCSQNKIKKYSELKDFGANVMMAKPFIDVDGKRQSVLSTF